MWSQGSEIQTYDSWKENSGTPPIPVPGQLVYWASSARLSNRNTTDVIRAAHRAYRPARNVITAPRARVASVTERIGNATYVPPRKATIHGATNRRRIS